MSKQRNVGLAPEPDKPVVVITNEDGETVHTLHLAPIETISNEEQK